MASPLTPRSALAAQFVGKTLDDVPTPSVILDLAKVERNCERMLDAAARLDITWRAHIKTHKTIELTRLQVGDRDTRPVNVIVSTVLEAENVLPLLEEYRAKKREVNVLYAFPLYPSSIERLAQISIKLGPSGLSVMVDHPMQLPLLAALCTRSGGIRPLVFVKIDMGSGRAGVVPGTPICAELLRAVLAAEKDAQCVLLGLYCHAGHSYYTRRDWEALGYLGAEFTSLQGVAAAVRAESPGHRLVLSVGATPTATVIQHPSFGEEGGGSTGFEAETTGNLQALFSTLRAGGLELEVHAGVYPTLDLQQLATHARDASLLTADDIAISVLAEVASLYEGRGAGSTTEALVNAGSLALGREPCKDMSSTPGEHYSGWGIVTPWRVQDNAVPDARFPEVYGGWQVGKISQEHGILTWQGSKETEVPLKIGQRVRIWPNHACIAGAGYDHYMVVDSRNEGRENEVVDVWHRWRGWWEDSVMS